MKHKFYTDNSKDINKRFKLYTKILTQNTLFESLIAENIRTNVLRHELRPYQMNALFTMDMLYKAVLSADPTWTKRLKDKNVQTSMAFHMATGSGKTVLIAGMMYWLHKQYRTKNFLILTPPAKSVIYDKTRVNFEKDSKDSVWGKGCDLNIEVIHGDNFDSSSLYDDEPDMRIFIFNVEKFTATAKKTKVPQEMSRWTDGEDNLISLADYLKQAHDLIIITDEAHHSADDKAIRRMIGGFDSRLLLEFTATSQDSQHVVYDYGIDQLLSQGLCKTIRALGVHGSTSKELLGLSNKRKLVVLTLLHFAKRYALSKTPDLHSKKVVSLIKVKNTNEDARKIFQWLQDGLTDERDLFLEVIEEMNQEDTPIGKIVAEMFANQYKNNLDTLLHDITILMGRQAMDFLQKANIENERLFSNVARNDIEIIVFNDRLNEGIDLPNIYNIAVINDSESNMLTSVKQVIGRGVRLFPELSPRRYDDEENIVLKAVEQVHIISDKGKNFEKAINQLREEWELINNKFFADENFVKDVTNVILTPIVGKKLPSFSASHVTRKDKETGKSMRTLDIIKDVKSVIDEFLPHACFGFRKSKESRYFLRFTPDSLYAELELANNIDDTKTQLQEKGKESILTIQDSWMKLLYEKISREVDQVGSIKPVLDSFLSYGKELNERKLYFYKAREEDEQKVTEQFKQQFEYFYRPYILKKLTWLNADPIEEMKEYPLENIFKEFYVTDMTVFDNSKDVTKQIQSGIWFDAKAENWVKSYYQYQEFDSNTERKTADLLDCLCKQVDGVWISNHRKYFLNYGKRRYFPDFVVVTPEHTVILEIKGEFFEESTKTSLLRLYGDTYKDQNFHGIMLYEDDIDALLSMKKITVDDLLDRDRLQKKLT